jgi:pre-mRNA-processing factor 17
MTVFEKTKERPKDKRKKIKNNDPSDVDGYLGPWSYYEDQELVSKPNEEEQKEINEILAKRKKRSRVTETEQDESKSTLHIKNPYDYMGRSFLHIPQDIGVNLRSETPPEKCFIPKKCVHTYTSHTKGVQKIALFPVSAHLFLTCSMDNKIKVCSFVLTKPLTWLNNHRRFIQAMGFLQRPRTDSNVHWAHARCA